ncbi:MAG: hypothetical protein WCR04_01180 [Fibrobacteraceae bacterium]
MRTLLVLVLLFLLYFNGLFHKAAIFIKSREEKDSQVDALADDASWSEFCKEYSGTSFPLKQDRFGQCSWVISSERDADALPPFPLVRYAVSLPGAKYPLKLHWIGKTSNFRQPIAFAIEVNDDRRWFFHIVKGDSLDAWVDENGCRFPGVCPRNPLEGGALPIADDFDFAGREGLLMKDLFMGIGEAPVYPVLPARVMDVSKDSSGFSLLLDHGGNLFSRVSGLFSLFPGIEKNVRIAPYNPIGRLASKDSSVFFLEILRNGRFMRWDDFYLSCHVATEDDLVFFRKDFGL